MIFLFHFLNRVSFNALFTFHYTGQVVVFPMGVYLLLMPHQWRSRSALKTGRREEPGPISGHASRPNRSEISVIFSETRINKGLGSLRKTCKEAFHVWSHVPHVTLGAKTYSQTTNLFLIFLLKCFIFNHCPNTF